MKNGYRRPEHELLIEIIARLDAVNDLLARTIARWLPPDYVSVRDAADILKVDRKTLARHVRDGLVPTYKMGGVIRVDLNQLRRILEEDEKK